jgi:3-hydroxy-9,10-secoandrosta-1,3,5(10)-triene-9,17-dione monooxygenase reductase component
MTTDHDHKTSVPGDRYRHVLGHFITGVTVVTAMHDDRPVGFTCQSFGALSLDPPLIYLCPGKSSSTWPKVRAAGRFTVNMLAHDQREVCLAFAVSGGDKFADVTWTPGKMSGAPVLAGTVGRVECEVIAEHDAGDHSMVVARVLDLMAFDRLPLTFFRGTLRGLHEPADASST